MFVFVDESGTFTSADRPDAWCVVAAYVSPERDRAALADLINRLRRECSNGSEAKLRDLSEEQYSRFLKQLGELNGLLFAVAVDVSLHSADAIAHHRDMQAAKIIEHRDKMRFESGRQALTDLSAAIGSLPVQLYTQLVCQVELFHKVLTRAPLYYVQRNPPTLGHLRWRVDRKAETPTRYETAFRIVLPALLQTKSFEDPMIMLEGADYTHFNRFDFAPGEQPDYLRTEYGIDTTDGANVGKMVGEDFKFVDSSLVAGVQVADLLASGLRRLFRGGFQNPTRVAQLLGANMVQEMNGKPLLRLISLDRGGMVSMNSAELIGTMANYARPMLARDQ